MKKSEEILSKYINKSDITEFVRLEMLAAMEEYRSQPAVVDTKSAEEVWSRYEKSIPAGFPLSPKQWELLNQKVVEAMKEAITGAHL